MTRNKKKFVLNLGDNLHHCYLIRGDIDSSLTAMTSRLREMGIKKEGNPDFWLEKFDSMGIDDTRTIKEFAGRRAFGLKKIIIIAINSITREAQNSLLKIFEDPPFDTHFFLLVPRSRNLLPTLESRLFKIEAENDDEAGLAETFVRMSLPERIAYAKEISEKIKDGKAEKQEVISLIESVLRKIHSESETKIGKKEAFVLSEIEKGIEYAKDQSPSIKMILEHISMIVSAEKK